MKKPMLSFHGKQSVKNKYLKRVKAHAAADKIVKGQYWTNGKGCAVGCTIEGSDHSRYETELGIPQELAYLEDAFFEDMPNKNAMKWPVRFLEAVPVGVDLSKVVSQFMIWQFEDKKKGLSQIKEVKEDKEVYGFCEEVVALYKRKLKGDEPSEQEFYDLYIKIGRARAGAWAWAWAWAGAGARAGARAWAWAWAGARARAGAGVDYEREVVVMADKLLDLIKKTKV